MRTFAVAEMAVTALFTAVTCLLAPLSIQIGPVPISFTNLVIYISIYVLGWKRAAVSYLLYLLLGMAGLPVFSGFAGGVAKLAGPTGGYLVGFLFMILMSGFFLERFAESKFLCGLGMLFGMAVTYAFGTFWFACSMQAGIAETLIICVYPFLPFDVIKIVVAAMVGAKIKRRIQ